ncbi:MAG: tetratricopeptide repeat protein [Bacteroidetes bacterium]|nr:tetratricopeptide repeat protein [Bacteroidota bacterium]
MKTFNLLFLILLSSSILSAQEAELALARQMVEEGNLKMAAEYMDQLSGHYPDNLEVQLYKAHVLAWSGASDASASAFRRILEEHPDHLEALTGLGYVLSWSNDFPNALYAFRDAIQVAPENTDARKGLAYGYLLRGNYVAAKYEFQELCRQHPKNPDYKTGLARAEYLMGDIKHARHLLQEVLDQDPDHSQAKAYMQEIRKSYSFLSADIWCSYSQIDTSRRLGFRQFQISYQFRPGRAAYARIDNSLSLDNLDFLNINKQAISVWLGYFHSWNEKLATRIELGERFNPTRDKDQSLIKVEQVFSLPAGLQWKLGGYVGLEFGVSTERLLWSGLYIPLRDGFSLEPAYFYSRDHRLAAPQQRVLLSGKWAADGGLEIGLGGFYGRQNIEGLTEDSRLYGGYLHVLTPINDMFWPQITAQYENGVFNNGLVLAAGLKVKI